MTASSTLGPTEQKDRILFLDILRGISILFIFIANSVFFSGFFNQSETTLKSFATYPLDNAVDFIAFTLIDGKFYSIFSMLFGIGFSLQYIRHNTSREAFVPFFSRRMLGLLLFGLFHIYFFSGDIVTLYALLGLLLILFRKCTNKQLIIWAIIFLLLAPLHVFLMQVSGNFYPFYFFDLFDSYWMHMKLPMAGETYNYATDFSYLHTTTSIKDFLTICLANPLNRLGGLLLEGRPFKVLGLFLIGVWAGRKIIHEDLLDNIAFLRQVVLWGFVLGLPMNLLRTCVEFEYLFKGAPRLVNAIFYTLGVTPLALAYAALLAIAHHNKRNWLKWFAPAGRMALTNYISQTFISIIIFYNIGFGLTGKWGMSISFILITGLFCLQVLYSKWWLKRFKYGPLEWMWRQMTYLKKIKNKRIAWH